MLNETIIALNHIKGVGKKRIQRILENVPENILDLNYFEAIKIGIQIGAFQKNMPIGLFLDAGQYAKKVVDYCNKHNIKIVNEFQEEYPEAMRFTNHPIQFFYAGKLENFNNTKRATVVGSRHPNEAGIEFAYNIGKVLAQNGFTVMSGLAPGCDTQAHRAALDYGAPIIAFTPTGINRYHNSKLAAEILVKDGLIVSEFSPFDVNNSKMFLVRDKLQAASTRIIFASEFDANSGTLQTLKFGALYNKPIYTLKKLTQDPDFDGYEHLNETIVNCKVLDWPELEDLIKNFNGDNNA